MAAYDGNYQALLVLSFGGPEKKEDVLPFLENVLRGRNVPRERMMEVAENYYRLGGKSPINEQIHALIAALESELAAEGPKLPIYWGNRNWHPFLPDTLRRMADDGIQLALVFTTSAYSSYSSCRQYLDDINAARAVLGSSAPECHKLRPFFNHPGFIGPLIERLKDALSLIPAERRAATRVLFTAHSIPIAMSQGASYLPQLHEVARLVAEGARTPAYSLVFQSRSGPPSQPWLEPDVNDALRDLAQSGGRDVVVAPIGFISDHMEVKFDLDTQAAETARRLGLNMVRAGTVGLHPGFIRMIRELILERTNAAVPRRAIGQMPAPADFCRPGCCPHPHSASLGPPGGAPGRPS